MITSDFLKKVDVFNDLNENQLKIIQENCQTAEFKKGDKIFGAGEDPLYLWVVLTGEVDLHWEIPGRSLSRSLSLEKSISTLTEASTFGWSSLVPPHKYRLSAYCASDTCTVVKIAREKLTALFDNEAAIGYKVMTGLLSVVGARFLDFQDEVAQLRGSDIINQW
jgi:signal-transduction protein with cAMP-binding, CBS, and nucleotidyltransferase domain